MAKQESLKPQDVVVALRLLETPEAPYANLGDDLGISPSTAHQSVERLRMAGLLRPESRHVNNRALMEFLEHGVRYMFPAKLDAPATGVPTAYSAPVFGSEIIADEAIVWPSINGSVVGQSMTPLYENAPQLPQRCPSLYDLLTLVDAIRVGRVRERAKAIKKLKARIDRAA